MIGEGSAAVQASTTPTQVRMQAYVNDKWAYLPVVDGTTLELRDSIWSVGALLQMDLAPISREIARSPVTWMSTIPADRVTIVSIDIRT